ncbi:sulfite exporter TauE/SafE family protein [Janibacter alittae]|uniref:Probable membrane transporter protein n=1 Tax=Janibacter alittae TaxID=3115209 RepID=A0ABZ2MJI7_9MICO
MFDVTSLLLVAFGVGIVIGLTGMGGGALMTPALIFLGIPPTTAVANDLVAAAVNKSVGAAAHLKHGTPDLKLAALLIVGSVPTAAAGGWLINQVGSPEEQQAFVKAAIGVALLLAAGTYVLRTLLNMRHNIQVASEGGSPDSDEAPSLRVVPTIVVGALGGLLVGLTSVGSGSLIMVALLMLYPRLAPNKLVGTDLVQAIPLVLAAAVGHVIYEGIDWSILLPLIIGGAPGTYLGARLASWVQQNVVRRGIAIVLSLTGLGMLGLPPVWVGIAGAALLVLGPIVWGLVRKGHGLPPFPNTREEGLQAAAERYKQRQGSHDD